MKLFFTVVVSKIAVLEIRMLKKLFYEVKKILFLVAIYLVNIEKQKLFYAEKNFFLTKLQGYT